ncbi:hypothetical protein KGQ20_28620 [Catenulispora sp. NF23]|uniref:Uncharacterized protein n=1 Tax=Catenulispora pinistramenti TaxID=2705254 RepID=A0ABS5KV07_9ACTN|nr:DUF6183 family protein [Catenulispora pinistramenti]MBS2536733.1 hypothetical protein [Catenulispora pinistramenti]MBS2549881.1 hypothetical protein [Catenulispora pinistramenti]
MVDQIDETVRSLRNLKHLHQGESEKVIRWVRGESARRLADGDPGYLGDLGIALLACHRDEPKAWQYQDIFDHLLRLLIGDAGKGDLGQALRLIGAARHSGHDVDRVAAALLAANRRRVSLTAVFAEDGSTAGVSDTFRACVVHELVLREGTISRRKTIADWAASPAMRNQPLGWLPLHLAPFELDGDQWPHATRPDRVATVSPDVLASWPATDLITPELSQALSAPVMNWVEDSNGRVETGVFGLAEPVRPQSVPEVLAGLGMDFLEPVDGPFRLDVHDTSVWDVWQTLFRAASGGGAYSRGCHGAYSRLFAWQALAALAGASANSPHDEVARSAQACTWHRFDGELPGFFRIFWDIGLVGVRPGGGSIAVLAATDTD